MDNIVLCGFMGCGKTTVGRNLARKSGRKFVDMDSYIEENKVTADTDLQEDLGADSLDVVDLLMSIEDEFGVEVPDDEIENIKTVGSLVSYIEANA